MKRVHRAMQEVDPKGTLGDSLRSTLVLLYVKDPDSGFPLEFSLSCDERVANVSRAW
jgi:hypothetical protein